MNDIYWPLFKEKNSRAFLKKALELTSPQGHKISISEFSKSAGFSSRSFISEYLSGRKKLSRESFNKIKSALKLSKNYKQFFSALVQLDQPELFKNKDRVVLDLSSLSETLLKQEKAILKIRKPELIINKASLFKLYASLGKEDQGTTLSEIVKKTNMSFDEVQSGLNLLIENQMAHMMNQRYYPLSSKVDFLHLKEKELASLTQQICSEIKNEASDLVVQDQSLLFYSSFSMNSYDRVRFKERLREVIYNVMDEFQVDDGDIVQQVFTCSKN